MATASADYSSSSLRGCYTTILGLRSIGMGNPVHRGHRFQRKADSNPVIADNG